MPLPLLGLLSGVLKGGGSSLLGGAVQGAGRMASMAGEAVVGGGGAGAGGGGGGFMKMMKSAVVGGGERQPPENWEEMLKNSQDARKLQKRQAAWQQEFGKSDKGFAGKMSKTMKGMAGKAGILGISTSVSSLARQSQLWTGFLGSLFQVIGAFIDVLLAPFMPMLFGLVAALGKIIPPTARAIRFIMKLDKIIADGVEWGIAWIAEKIVDLWKWLSDLDIGANIWDAIKRFWNYITWWSGPFHPFKKMFEVISGIIGFIVSIIKGVWDWLKELPFTIGAFFISIKNKLVDIWNGVTGWIGDVFEGTWEKIKKAAGWVWDTLQTGWGKIKELFDWLGGAFQTGWEKIKDAGEWIGGAFKTAWDGIKDGVKTAVDWVGDTLKKGWTKIKDVFDWLGGTFKTGWETLKTAFETLKGWVSEVKTIFVDKVKKVVDWMWNTGKRAIANIVNLLTTVGGYVMGGFDTLRGLLQNYIINPLKLAWTWITTKPWEFITNLFDGILNAIKGFFQLTWLRNILATVIEKFGDMVYSLGEVRFLGKLKDAAGKIHDAAALIRSSASEASNGSGHPGQPGYFYRGDAERARATQNRNGTENTLTIKIDMNGGLGIPNEDSQVMFDKNKKSADLLLNSIRLGTEASTSSWWNPSSSAFQ